jgi:hypothetical protein
MPQIEHGSRGPYLPGAVPAAAEMGAAAAPPPAPCRPRPGYFAVLPARSPPALPSWRPAHAPSFSPAASARPAGPPRPARSGPLPSRLRRNRSQCDLALTADFVVTDRDPCYSMMSRRTARRSSGGPGPGTGQRSRPGGRAAPGCGAPIRQRNVSNLLVASRSSVPVCGPARNSASSTATVNGTGGRSRVSSQSAPCQMTLACLAPGLPTVPGCPARGRRCRSPRAISCACRRAVGISARRPAMRRGSGPCRDRGTGLPGRYSTKNPGQITGRRSRRWPPPPALSCHPCLPPSGFGLDEGPA